MSDQKQPNQFGSNKDYAKYGFTTDIEEDRLPPGLDESTIRFISAKKEEPEWMLQFRLKAFETWKKMKEPHWAHLDYPQINFQDIVYYSAPKQKPKLNSLDEVDPKLLETVLYQYVRVRRGADAVKMSKRAGNFVTAEEVLGEVGKDAFRFFLLMRAPESHLDFDLELAKKHSQENPVYYVQYAHARLAAIERKAKELGLENLNDLKVTGTEFHVADLNLPEERELIQAVSEFPEEVERAAKELTPHRIAFYLLELSKLFQAYYAKAKEDDRYRVLVGSVDSIRAKRYLCAAVKLTIAQGLKLLGVSAPEVMQQEN